MRDTAVTSRGSETDSRSSVVPSFDSSAEGRGGLEPEASGLPGISLRCTDACREEVHIPPPRRPPPPAKASTVGRMELSADLKAYIELQPAAALWFSGHSLTWIRASGANTAGRLSVVEHIVPPGSASPWHVHQTEDESFYVVDGQISVKVEGQARISVGAGGFAFGPMAVPHGFRVESEVPSRILLITNGPEFADFIREASDQVDTNCLPEQTPADAARLKAAAARHCIAILGPPQMADAAVP
jgi:quercetin dioxygenase-like cupin family protein